MLLVFAALFLAETDLEVTAKGYKRQPVVDGRVTWDKHRTTNIRAPYWGQLDSLALINSAGIVVRRGWFEPVEVTGNDTLTIFVGDLLK